ncbi:hypothetical protein [Flammeovirga kamogawensis]|uniref:Uncharacterized protein n=1 Tax=Flammeovirga kamogawensis TaxID=373891 RepID=A0ABX8H1H5_9BACT|nr:hypothetical protein [Flammeovirga kamogawensis]MBB6463744.1 hypothetical protein [Flammeovirga kamogawensis]QWG09744.1 hypothetical protein KM029_24405 [Flammeovirga kamogawensis]TRX65257.1 hypothetical protein EO216_22295 [Flammeovirga kamogawensis]
MLNTIHQFLSTDNNLFERVLDYCKEKELTTHKAFRIFPSEEKLKEFVNEILGTDINNRIDYPYSQYDVKNYNYLLDTIYDLLIRMDNKNDIYTYKDHLINLYRL